MSDPLPKVLLCFRFYGEEFDPDEITRRLGLEPTSIFRPGDPITTDGRGRRRRFGWRLKVGYRETLELDGLIGEFRDLVDVPGALVRQICDELDVEAVVLCGVLQGDSEILPALAFPADFLEWVSRLGASLDVDVM